MLDFFSQIDSDFTSLQNCHILHFIHYTFLFSQMVLPTIIWENEKQYRMILQYKYNSELPNLWGQKCLHSLFLSICFHRFRTWTPCTSSKHWQCVYASTAIFLYQTLIDENCVQNSIKNRVINIIVCFMINFRRILLDSWEQEMQYNAMYFDLINWH